MRKLYFLLFGFFFFITAKAQIAFTDIRLKDKLVAASLTNGTAKDINGNPMVVDVNANGEIEVSEALNVYDINAGALTSADGISSIGGLYYFTNLKKLDVQHFTGTTLNVTIIPQLEELNCSHSEYIEHISLSISTNLKRLNCSSMTNLNQSLNVSMLSALQYLNCSSSGVAILNIAGLTNLIELDIHDNNIATINLVGMVNLKKLDVHNNIFSQLGTTTLSHLETIDCSYNHLIDLSFNSNTTLKTIECSHNPNLTTLQVRLCTNLETLKCSYVALESLDIHGMQHLTYLDCSNSEDSIGVSQPTLNVVNARDCIALTTLLCQHNNIYTLSLTNSTAVTNLQCDGNFLTALNLSTLANLRSLNCSWNYFTTIDLTHNLQLENFICTNSNLVTANLSPLANLTSFDLSDSSSLKYLLVKNGKNPLQPGITYVFDDVPELAYMCADENNIAGYNQIASGYGLHNLEINSYCSFTPGGTYYSLNGNVTYDENNNGCDASDPKAAGVEFSVGTGSLAVYAFSGENGEVFIPIQTGPQTFYANLENQNYFNVTPASVNVNFPTTVSPFTQDFCVSPNGNHPDLEIVMVPIGIARPGFDAKYKLICRNKGTNTQSANIVLTFDDAILDLVSAEPAAAQSTNTLTWNLSDLHPFESRVIKLTLNANSPIEVPPVYSGTILNFNASIDGSLTDELPSDNAFAWNQTVINSFDPNDKTCLEGNTITPEMVGKEVHYMIRFENTGTANAENIVVKDMIDATKFDISSLIPIDGSHPFVTKISNTNKVEFIFENINLPFDDANNDGYIAFKIKTKPTLVLGNIFSNTASIYFDYNAPIITDPAITTVALLANQDFAFEQYFKIYPNPVKDILNIETKQTTEVTSINIYNSIGQLVLVIPNAQQTKSVDVANLETGNYFIKMNTAKGSANVKFVKR